MLRSLIERNVPIRYCPNMSVKHAVESWRLTRGYFLKLHYRAGLRKGRFQLPEFSRTVLGVPPFLIRQYLRQGLRTIGMLITGRPGTLRQAMNTAHALGLLIGYTKKNGPPRSHP